jgi:hypothetical protein
MYHASIDHLQIISNFYIFACNAARWVYLFAAGLRIQYRYLTYQQHFWVYVTVDLALRSLQAQVD